MDEHTRLYVEARFRLAIGATLAACLLLISLAMPWVSIGGHDTLVWDISYPLDSDGQNWGPGLTAALIGLTAARPRPTTANTAAVFIVITAVMMGRLVATVFGHDAELGPGFTYAGLGLVLALIVVGPIGWRGWPPEL